MKSGSCQLRAAHCVLMDSAQRASLSRGFKCTIPENAVALMRSSPSNESQTTLNIALHRHYVALTLRCIAFNVQKIQPVVDNA